MITEQDLATRKKKIRRIIADWIYCVQNKIPLSALYCPNCGKFHDDYGQHPKYPETTFGRKAHQVHTCQYCGVNFKDVRRSVSSHITKMLGECK